MEIVLVIIIIIFWALIEGFLLSSIIGKEKPKPFKEKGLIEKIFLIFFIVFIFVIVVHLIFDVEFWIEFFTKVFSDKPTQI
ncbi:MAG: hypothetical protein U9N49_03500 [Campylobacterota bacterium]|nr:hypothetical protein [Campylobacterota bacterium]